MKLRELITAAAAAVALDVAPALAAEVDPPAVVGRLNYLSGPVSFAAGQSVDGWAAATLNRPLTSGDRLWTGEGARAEVHVGSLAIRLAAQTGMDIVNLDERAVELRVARGIASLRVRRLADDQLLVVLTPAGAAVVKRPGAYRVDVDPSGLMTRVTVRAGGEAEILAGGSRLAVRSGEAAELAGGGRDIVTAPAPDEFDRWTAGRDQREDSVASTRYVPEEMTGYEDLDHYGTWRSVEDYGPVWVPSSAPAGWAPYRFGQWARIPPWGWTWVDDAPWGFAPFHYGRWVWLGDHWAWAPGRRVARPVYAPALVAFIGGPGFSIAVGSAPTPAVGWVPLGHREAYRPWYRASHHHVRNVNFAHVTNVINIHGDVAHLHLANRGAPSGVTVVSREHFYASRRVQHGALRVPERTLAAARVHEGGPEQPHHGREWPRREDAQGWQRQPLREHAREREAREQETRPHGMQRQEQERAGGQQRQHALDRETRERAALQQEARRQQQERAREQPRGQVPQPLAGRQPPTQPRPVASHAAPPRVRPGPQPELAAPPRVQSRAQPEPPQRRVQQSVPQQRLEPARAQGQAREARGNGPRDRPRPVRADRG